MAFHSFSNRPPAVDPRTDRLVEQHAAVQGAVADQTDWVAEINMGLERALDEIAFNETKRLDQLALQQAHDAWVIRKLNVLESRPVIQQLPARYDDSKLKDHISSLENLALEAIDQIDNVGKRCEMDIRQLRTDLLHVARRLQQMESFAEMKSLPWWKRLFSRKK